MSNDDLELSAGGRRAREEESRSRGSRLRWLDVGGAGCGLNESWMRLYTLRRAGACGDCGEQNERCGESWWWLGAVRGMFKDAVTEALAKESGVVAVGAVRCGGRARPARASPPQKPVPAALERWRRRLKGSSGDAAGNSGEFTAFDKRLQSYMKTEC